MTTVNGLDKIVARKKHKNKEIERAIKFAEKYGWGFRKAKGAAHPFGILRCPHNDYHCRCGIYCQISVWSTPKTPEAHARKIRRAVENCLHQFEKDNENQVVKDG